MDKVTKHKAAARFLDMLPGTCQQNTLKKESVRKLRDETMVSSLDAENVIRFSGCWIDPRKPEKAGHVGSYVNVFTTSTAQVIQKR